MNPVIKGLLALTMSAGATWSVQHHTADGRLDTRPQLAPAPATTVAEEPEQGNCNALPSSGLAVEVELAPGELDRGVLPLIFENSTETTEVIPFEVYLNDDEPLLLQEGEIEVNASQKARYALDVTAVGLDEGFHKLRVLSGGLAHSGNVVFDSLSLYLQVDGGTASLLDYDTWLSHVGSAGTPAQEIQEVQ